MLIVIESIKNKITTIRKYQELYIKIFVLLLTKGKKHWQLLIILQL